MANRRSAVRISIPTASSDSKYYGRYPSGNAPLGGALAITTASLTDAVVGAGYSGTLAASGGAGGYKWNLESVAPHWGLWLGLTRAGSFYGTPQNVETSTIVVRCTDAAGATVTATLTLNVTNTGSLAIVTSAALFDAPINGIYSQVMVGSGGVTPYKWLIHGIEIGYGKLVGSATYAMTPDGVLLAGGPAATQSGSFQIDLVDNVGTTVSLTVTHNFTAALAFLGIDNLTGRIKLPPTRAGQKYVAQLQYAGGSGSGYAVSLASGSPALPAGLSMNAAGAITGTLGTDAGNMDECVFQLADNAAHSATATGAMNIGATSQVSRPSYNTGTGFFVDANGIFRDPGGFEFPMRGWDRAHYDADWTPNPKTRGNAVRMFTYTEGTGGIAASTYATRLNTDHITNDQFPILTTPTIAGTYTPSPTYTSGRTTTSDITTNVSWWTDPTTMSALSSIAPYIGINIANEWGASNSTTWRDTYISAVQSLRTAGWKSVIVIDAGGAGQDEDGLVNYAAAILAADTQRNIIFGYHLYGATTNFVNQIASITKGSSTVIHLNSSSSIHPFSQANGEGNGYWFPTNKVICNGVSGMTGINGVEMTATAFGGSAGNWTITTSYNSSGLSGTASGGTVIDKAHYSLRIQRLAALRSSGIRVGVLEYGPPNLEGNGSETFVTQQQVVQTCMAYNVDFLDWAWDDHTDEPGPSGSNNFGGWFGSTLTNAGGTYTYGRDLTYSGLAAVGDPRIGFPFLASPAPTFL